MRRSLIPVLLIVLGLLLIAAYLLLSGALPGEDDTRPSPLADVAAAAEAGLPFGNYFNWWLESAPPLSGKTEGGDEIRFWQMVPVRQDGRSRIRR